MLVIIFFTSGTLWPVEGMPTVVRKLLLANPTVLPIRSLRSIMLRGWSAAKFSVLVGYIVSAVSCLVQFAIGSLFFHYLNV